MQVININAFESSNTKLCQADTLQNFDESALL